MNRQPVHRPSRLVARLLGLGLLLTAPAAANVAGDLSAVPAFSLAPAALLAAADAVPAETGENVRILLSERLVRFEADGSQTSSYRLVYRVLSAAGVESWANLSAAWRPWHQERPSLRSRVVAPDGTEHWLDPATIGERPLGDATANILTDRLVVEAPLPGVTVGSVVEQSIETRDVRPLFAHGTVDVFPFAFQDVAVERTRLVIDAPESLSLRYLARLLDGLEPRRSTVDGRVVLTFEAGPRQGIESIEELAPGTVAVWPQVIFSTGASWADVAGAYHRLVEAQLADLELDRVVSQALRAAAGRDEKIARLLARVHEEVRYTGVEFAEAAIVPRPPSETLKRGYGDCKDKATLLVAMLRTAGIPADVALLATGPGPDVAAELPGLGFFDHAIVHVPGTPELWIDPTDEFARVGELPAADQSRLALIANPATRELVTTPAAGPGENGFAETRELFLAADLGGARLVETTRYWGAFERGQRATFSLSAPEDLEESFSEYVESTYSAEELVAWEHSDPRDLSKPFELRLEAREVGVAFTDLAEAAVYLAPDALLNELPLMILTDDSEDDPSDDGITSDQRRADVVLPVPYTAEHHYRIVPPDGYRPVDLPEAEQRQLGPAALTREVRQEDDGTVHLSFRFDTGKRRLLPAEMEALREGAQELFEQDVIEIEFEQVAEAHIAAGDIPAALAETDRLIAAAPERALPRTRRARALLAGGLGTAARREAAAAVELEPELYLAHQTLGLVHIHDLVGREFRKGMDREIAAQAFRKAVELEPDDETDRRNLAVLLERDEEGDPYAPGASLDEAIEQYEALCDDPETACDEQNLLVLLARTGRFEEMLERATDPGRDTDGYSLVALAAVRGPQAAVRGARKIRDDAQRQTALATAAQTLMQLRLYPQSADLFAAAAQGSGDPAKILGLVTVLRRARRLEELELSDSDPADVARQLMASMVAGDRDAVQALISHDAGRQEQLEESLFGEFESYVASSRRMLMRQVGMSFRELFEIGFAAMQFSVDGDDEVGYRVRMRGDIAGSSAQETLFFVRRDGAYRLAADAKLPSLGHVVLRQLEAGNPAAARQWLDWACDLTTAPSADDPYAGVPFFHFWSKGRQGGAEEIRAAAASLLVRSDAADTAISMLLEGRDRAAGDERTPYEIALAQAYDELDRGEPLALLARGWLAEHPESAAAFGYLRRALVHQDRWDELERAARERLDAMAGDPVALWALVQVARKRHDREEERRLYHRLIDLGHADGNVYNNLAWLDVVEGTVSEQTVDWAQKAIGHRSSRARLHTLATAYAELGRSSEARQLLLQAMTIGNDDEPTSEDWYVWGLIAESYGVPDSAADAYRKVEPPEDPDTLPHSTHQLAQERLQVLNRPASRRRGEQG